MSLKSKLLSTIAALMIALSLLVVGVLALRDTNFNIGGTINFTAKGINATITNGALNYDEAWVNSADKEVKLKDVKYSTKNNLGDYDHTTAIESWSGLNLQFNDNGDDVVLSFTITNTSTSADDVVEVNITTSATSANNVTITSSATTLKVNNSTPQNVSITFHLTNPDIDGNIPDFDIGLELTYVNEAPVKASDFAHLTFTPISGKEGEVDVRANNTDSLFDNFCDANEGKVTIPSKVTLDDGKIYTISQIFDAYSYSSTYGAFYNKTKLKEIAIPDSVTSIGERAFYGCSGLASIKIPDSVTSIGSQAFWSCSGIIGELIIPAATTFIGDGAFYNCGGLTGELIIPNKVKNIGSSAFMYCKKLESVIISDSVTDIGSEAFYDCNMLTNVVIGSGVTSIGDSAFKGCVITDIIVSEKNSKYYSKDSQGRELKAIVDGDTKTLIKGCNNSILYSDSDIITIAPFAFSGCSGLTGEIIIPDSVTSIGSAAFSHCSGLTGELIIPDALTIINPEAFNYCSKLTGELIIPDKVTSIGIYAFGNCRFLSVIIPDSVTEIGFNAFYCCGWLESATIGNGVKSIGSDAFNGCNSLKCITIPNSVTSIGSSAFKYCADLAKMTVDSAIVANGITSNTAMGYLLWNSVTKTVYIKSGLDTSGSTYLTGNFTKQDTSDKAGYDMWTR